MTLTALFACHVKHKNIIWQSKKLDFHQRGTSDVTILIWKNESKYSPIYIFKLRSGIKLGQVSQGLRLVEASYRHKDLTYLTVFITALVASQQHLLTLSDNEA